jgi:hypothetical protein
VDGEGGSLGVDDAIRQIRTTPGDQFEGQWGDGADVFAHPRRDVRFIDSDDGTVHKRGD